jgi:hypothetical protein
MGDEDMGGVELAVSPQGELPAPEGRARSTC